MNLTKIPEHMREGVINYIEHGVRPGRFLEAVLRNGLVWAASVADKVNSRLLCEWALVMCSEFPINCWGSHKMVEDWIQRGGLRGG